MTINLNEIPRGGTVCLTKAGLLIGSTPAQIAWNNPDGGTGITYAINGILYYLVDSASTAITAAAVQPVLTKCLYLVCLSTTGALTTVKGTAQLTASLTAGTVVLEWPTPTVNTCCIGAIKVQTLVAGTFTAGTTALTPGAALAVTYYDLFSVPVAPLTS